MISSDRSKSVGHSLSTTFSILSRWGIRTQDLMASMQETVPGGQPGEWWAEMKLVFTL